MVDHNEKMEMERLINKLNSYRDAYYNKNTSLISDKEYDELYDILENLEKKTGIIMANSPTQTIGYKVQSKLKKVKHSHPMQSLDKIKDIEGLCKFVKRNQSLMMLKMDGLTCSLHYDENGNLVSAETRGDGLVGEDITENIKMVNGVPLKVNNQGVPLTVDGEIIVRLDFFKKYNESLSDKNEEQFMHPRNYASGSIRQLDTKVTKERNLSFVAWKLIDGYPMEHVSLFRQLNYLGCLGFTSVPCKMIYHFENPETQAKEIEGVIEFLKNEAKRLNYPIDGMVIAYDDLVFGASLGSTSHHPLHSISYKFYDERVKTKLIDIVWNATRTGVMAPVGIFNPVDLDGAITSRATLHNVSYIKKLKLGIGDEITVYRANQVIPKIDGNLTNSDNYKFPKTCCSCGSKLVLKSDGIAENLYCENDNCPAKNLSRFVHFVGKSGMNIDGLSEATLEKFIDSGFITKFADIYHLSNYRDKIIEMDGFGEKSYNKLIKSIEASRKVKLENYLVALGIPLIGKSAAKTISKYFHGDMVELIWAVDFDFTQLEDFGEAMAQSMKDWLKKPFEIENGLIKELEFIIEKDTEIKNDFIAGKIFCVTGAFNTMKRSEIEKIITERGGKLSGSVSKKTNYLLTNEADSGSSKALKAKELGTPIMSEADFISRI